MLKIALRNIKRNKLMTIINIFSLAIGISASLVIFLFVQYDYSFDRHVADKDRVYRVVIDGTFRIPGIIPPLLTVIEEETSNHELLVPILTNYNDRISIQKANTDDKQSFNKDNNLVFTNSKYFELYPHTWLAGDANALNQANSIVITDRNLARYFPHQSPTEVLGKTLAYSDSINLQVAGVVKEMKENSDFKYQGFISTATIPIYPSLKKNFAWESWTNYQDNINGLVKLPKGVSAKEFEKTLLDITHKHKKAEDGFKDNFMLQPLSDVHFNADFNYNATKPDTLRNLIILALFLLSLGIINFINLTTAQSTERAKEIGIRKTLGSSKARLTRQFLSETFLITLTATVLSILLTPIFLKAFSGFIPAGLTITALWTPMAIGFVFLFLVIVTLFAGFYPAWVLTGFSPVLALKNQVSQNSNLSRTSWVRKAMTIFQFVLAQVFLICVIIVVKQIQFIESKDMGFQKEAIVNFFIPGSYQNSAKGSVLKDKLATFPEIQAISFGNQSPAMNGQLSTTITLDHESSQKTLNIDFRNGDPNYLEVYQIPLIAGRNIQLRDSSSEVLINEKALEFLHIKSPEEALGITMNKGSMTIVGVMKDFDMTSAKQVNRPLLYSANKEGYVMHIRLDKNNPSTWKNSLAKIEKEYKNIFPNDEFDFKFLDETIQKFYQKDQQLSKLLTWAVSLSIVIAGLGLFGLGLFTANQRTKEIGIRKVLGASILQLQTLLLKNLLALVGIACLIAFPIAWYFGNKWLEGFAYKSPIDWWIFPLSALGLMIIATLILFSKTYLSAKANPVDSLRDE